MQSPSHYGDTRLMDLLIDKQVPFAEGNICKYVVRWKEKDGLKDLYKARDYLNAVISHEELTQGIVGGKLVYPSLNIRRTTDAHGPISGACMQTGLQSGLPESEGN